MYDSDDICDVVVSYSVNYKCQIKDIVNHDISALTTDELAVMLIEAETENFKEDPQFFFHFPTAKLVVHVKPERIN